MAVVAVIEQALDGENNERLSDAPNRLKILTLAAMALPGIALTKAVMAEDDEGSFNYSYYQEGKRNLLGLPNTMQPIRVDTLNSTGSVSLSDFDRLNVNYIQDSWSGATPITTAVKGFMIEGLSGASSHVNTGKAILVDKNFHPLKPDYPDGQHLQYVNDAGQNQLVHMLTSASPETRKEVDLRYSHDWNQSSGNLGAGISSEPDYESMFVNSGFKHDFNQKLTSLSAGMGYTASEVNAVKMQSAQGYIDYGPYAKSGTSIHQNRQDWTGNIGLSQILDKFSFISTDFNITHSSGFLSNPYKAATFIFKDPNQDHGLYPQEVYRAELTSILEKRPYERNQFSWNIKYARYFDALNGAVHFGYGLSDDTWGILAHTFNLSWNQSLPNAWVLTPSVRYYSQDAADFYQPIFYVDSLKPKNPKGQGVDINKLPYANFSSDHRLSGFGSLSGGISLSKQFAKGVTFKAGFEYYTHQGSMKLGGGGENAYADFDYYQVSAGLKVNLSALGSAMDSAGGHSPHHHLSHLASAPSGVLFDHMLQQADEWMLGYRYMYGSQDGNLLNGTNSASDRQFIEHACAPAECSLAPSYMHMHMHMVDIMYAPTDWLNLMLMPQFVDMNMEQRPIGDAADQEFHHHRTAGVGDTGLYALFKLYNQPNHSIHTTLGISAPTGKANLKLNPGHHAGSAGFLHYGMQLGSGTWDFRPSLTYNGKFDDWFIGSQVAGYVRMQDRNSSGYALGNEIQLSAWNGYNFNQWLSGTIRGIYTNQGSISNQFNADHPTTSSVDFAANYGGQFVDIGLGLNVLIPETVGALGGHHVGVEWLQPVMTDFNGYQLDRVGALSANWGVAF